MRYQPSKLFDKPGYLPLREYLEDIVQMRKHGPWKLPLGMGDRLQLFFLAIVAKISWFADSLFVIHPHSWSPAYSILLSYLGKHGFFDDIQERRVRFGGYSSYSLGKNIFINDFNHVVSGRGVSRDKSRAFSKAIGEIIERMVSGVFDKNRQTIFASPDEIIRRHPVLYPPQYHRFLDIQKKNYRELQHRSSNPLEWVRGRNLITGKRTYIPKQITSWFGGARHFKDVLLQPTSSGAAGYFTETGAILRGLLELVQRDGFLVHWLTMTPPNLVTHNSLPEDVRKTIEEFESRGISLYVLDVTSLSIPSVSILAINAQAETPQAVLSGAAATTFHEAVQDALEEMMGLAETFYESRDWKKWDEKFKDVPPFISDIGKTSRQIFWHGARLQELQWFISGKEITYEEAREHDKVCSSRDSQRLQVCLEALKKRGSEYYPIVYCPKNSLQESLGFYVAQVYIPKAFPFYLNECWGTFDSDRLRDFAISKNISERRLNPLPHMFL